MGGDQSVAPEKVEYPLVTESGERLGVTAPSDYPEVELIAS